MGWESGTGAPCVSVVVPTFNRADRLPRLLDALAGQRGAPPFEVIVVDDASPDDTPAVLARLTEAAPMPVRAIRQAVNSGPAKGRNRGWQVARAPLVCFTDDDCVPTEGWLAALAGALETHDIAQGRTLPNPDHEANRGPFSHTLEVLGETGYYETANMGYRREVLEKVGGFDESFRFPYGEDCDLAWRAKAAGATSCFVPDALVHHDITPSRWTRALKGTRRREGIVQLFSNHPSLRTQLGKGLFYEPTHLPALAGVACAVALVSEPRSARRWALSAVAGLWYAKNCRRTHGRPQNRLHWLAVVPAAWVVDMADMGVLASASARYRTLQL